MYVSSLVVSPTVPAIQALCPVVERPDRETDRLPQYYLQSICAVVQTVAGLSPRWTRVRSQKDSCSVSDREKERDRETL